MSDEREESAPDQRAPSKQFRSVAEALLYIAVKSVVDDDELECRCDDFLEEACPVCMCRMTLEVVEHLIAKREESPSGSADAETQEVAGRVQLSKSQSINLREEGRETEAAQAAPTKPRRTAQDVITLVWGIIGVTCSALIVFYFLVLLLGER